MVLVPRFVSGSIPLAGLLVSSLLTGCALDSTGSNTSETDTTVGQSSDQLHLFSQLCGGFANATCNAGQVCAPLLARGCPGPRRVGVCLPRPHACPSKSSPVCGCDGSTYDSFCEAAAAGVSVEHRGPCAPSGEPVCGGAAGTDCAGAGTCEPDAPHCDPAVNPTCTGVCTCSATGDCPSGQVWDADATVCGCVPAPSDPCDAITCMGDEVCVDNGDGTASCVPDTNPCDAITCMGDEVCVDNGDGTASCVPANPCDSLTCMGDEICIDNGDGTGSCVPADPCATITCMGGEVCVDNGDGTGSCVAQATMMAARVAKTASRSLSTR
jgi:hypothetical protein